ncbi:MAG: type II toxin-antitoxin system prevent-host-death family antitoxin [Aliidongia sp.]
MAHRVSAREANQQFSDILSRAARGEAVVITRRGEPVAQLTKFGVNAAVDDNGAAWDRLTAILESGFSLGGASFDRDELYQR